MSRHAWSRSSLVALVALSAIASACASPAAAPSPDPSAPLVETYPVAGGGQIVLTVQHRYLVGRPIVVQVAITAGALTIRGPIAATVLSSGFEGEKVIRTIAPSLLGAATVAPNARTAITVTWDGKDDAEKVAPKDTYTLTFDFVVGEETQRVGTTIELATP